MSAFALPAAPHPIARVIRRSRNAPLPLRRVRSFGDALSPVIFTAQDDLTSELLRFL
jgi:hypothetical protein